MNVMILLNQTEDEIKTIKNIWNNTNDDNLIDYCINQYNLLLNKRSCLIKSIKKDKLITYNLKKERSL